MFEQHALVFYYNLSPVHMGAGTALGAIDNPVQRERHTGHPVYAGSGLKGALRAHAARSWKPAELQVVFGPEVDHAQDFAGAVGLSDAQLVAFPVRSLRNTFVYATCPTALQRLARLASMAGREAPRVALPQLERDEAGILDDKLGVQGKLVLEGFSFQVKNLGAQSALGQWAETLGDLVFGKADEDGSWRDYFATKLRRHLVLLHDDRFKYFAQYSTFVEPHVRIDDATGTADDGGLFYTENVPPEALFAGLLLASRTRAPKDADGSEDEGDNGAYPSWDASTVLSRMCEAFDQQVVQIGGDTTNGRGLVRLRVLGR